MINLANILPNIQQLEFVKGIEGELIKRKGMERMSGFIAIAAALLQIIIGVANTDYLNNLGSFFINLSRLELDPALLPEFVGVLVVAAAAGTYLLLRRTSFLIKESEQPFQYTFWVEPFKLIKQNPEKNFTASNDDQHDLLRHDISERINQRIQRFSLLNEEDLTDEEKKALISHIHICGDYGVREEEKGRWIIYVTSRVRVGPRGRPETLSHIVNFPLDIKKDSDSSHSMPNTDLDADRYNQLIERVYSSIATEIYRRILSDVKEKIAMFPTNYLRYVALFYEAKDFERSNTVDAYDHAIELYREALHYFDTRLFGWKEDLLLRFPFLWRFAAKPSIMEARTRIGYCRCLTYRKILSSFSGMRQNALYEVPDEIQKAICKLIKLHNRIHSKSWEIRPLSDYPNQYKKKSQGLGVEHRYRAATAFLTFPRDSALRRKQHLFDKQRKSLFDAYTVGALAYSQLEATGIAEELLQSARAIDPIMSQENSLWLLAKSETVPRDQRLPYIQQAIEISPCFEIPLYRRAQYSEQELRIKNEVNKERMKNVIKQYNEVLRINPGNIAALVAQGYVYWLVEDLDEAKEKFERGLGYKAIVSEAFIGDLYYGLARIAVEKGEFSNSFEFYTQAISSDPGVAAVDSATTAKRGVSSYYDYISPDILLRYQTFKRNVDAYIDKIIHLSKKKKQDDQKTQVSKKTLDSVYSFVLNDYGNACLNYYIQFGKPKNLEEAIHNFEEAVKLNRENVVAYLNLEQAYEWQDDSQDRIENCLEHIELLAGSWTGALNLSTKSRFGQIDRAILDKTKNIEVKRANIEKLKSKIQDLQGGRDLEKTRNEIGEKSEKEFLKEKDDYEKQIKDNTWEIADLEEAIRKLNDQAKVVFETKIGKLISLTTFDSIAKQCQFSFDGEGVADFCKIKVANDRLDEDDIEVVTTWAYALSINKNEKALLAAEKLCEYVLEYSPENFDAEKTLYFVLGFGRHENKQEIHLKRLKNILKNALYQDRVRYLYWVWAEILFTIEKDYYELLENDPKMSLVSAFHFGLGKLRRNLADEQGKNETWEKAVASLEKAVASLNKALELDSDNELYCRELELALNDYGNYYFDKADYRNAAERYKEAINVGPPDAVIYSNLALALSRIREPGKMVGVLDEVMFALRKALEIDTGNTEYVDRLKNIEKLRSTAIKLPSPIYNQTSEPTSVYVEITSDLRDHVTLSSVSDALSDRFSNLLGEMRTRIQEKSGVIIPGIKFRYIEGFQPPSGTYLIKLMNIEVARGRVMTNSYFFPGTPSQLDTLRIVGEKISDSPTDFQGYWINKEDWEKITQSGLQHWDAAEYMVRHLEAVLQNNLAEFI